MPTNMFSRITKKDIEEFSKLSNEKKAEVIQSAVQEKVSEVMNSEIAKAIITGAELERERIYKRYVSKVDECLESDATDNDELDSYIDDLLSYIRMEHLKFIKKHGGA